MLANLWTLTAAGVVLLGIYHVLWNLFLTPLRVYPGPLLWKLSHIPADYWRMKGTYHLKLHQLHQTYGPVVRIRPNELSSIKGTTWTEVYKPSQPEFMKCEAGPPPNGVHGLAFSPSPQHSRNRKLLSHAFSLQGMREQEPRIQKYVDQTIAGITKQSSKGPVDMLAWMNWTTFDIIGDLAFGEPFGCCIEAQSHPWIESIQKNLPAGVAMVVIQTWGLMPLVNSLLTQAMKDARDEFYGFISAKIQKRLQKRDKDRGDFLDHILKYDIIPEHKFNDEKEKGMTLKELESNASDLMFAGSETTATALSVAIFFLLQNPNVLRRATEEVRQAYNSDTSISLLNASAEKLPYLMAVFEEALRIHPPAPTMTFRSVPEGGAVIDGRPLPAGTRIGIAQYPAFLSPYNFYEPTEFHPQRWLPNKPKEFKDDNPEGIFQPFSYGVRNCIGMNLAYSEARLVMSKLLWRFDLSKPEDAGKTWDDWIINQKAFFLWLKDPLMVNVTLRKDIKS